jgi:hypothetical protein
VPTLVDFSYSLWKTENTTLAVILEQLELLPLLLEMGGATHSTNKKKGKHKE